MQTDTHTHTLSLTLCSWCWTAGRSSSRLDQSCSVCLSLDWMDDRSESESFSSLPESEPDSLSRASRVPEVIKAAFSSVLLSNSLVKA